MKKGLIPPVAVYLALLAVLILSIPTTSYSDTSKKHLVEDIIYDDNNNLVTIWLDFDLGKKAKKPSFKYNSISGNRFYLDVLNSYVDKPLDFRSRNGKVKRIRRNQFNRSTSRVVLYLDSKNIKPTVSYLTSPSRILIDLGSSKSTNAKPKTSSRKKSRKPSKVFRIMIDPGHGGKFPGAIGPKGTKEKKVTLAIAKELEKLLRGRDDVVVKMTRSKDNHIHHNQRMDILKRKKMADDWNADLFISIHANSNRNKNLERTEIYYRDNKSFHLAKVIRDELLQELSGRSSTVRKHPYASVIKRNPAKRGSVLVEAAYISNRQGERRLNDRNYQKKIARGISESIESYLDLNENNN